MPHLLFLVLTFLLALGGCATQAVQVRGVAPLNRNAEGESTPVDLRFYLLRSDAAFASASFTALWTGAKQVLGSDLIGEPVVVTVLPGAATDPAHLVPLGQGQAAWVGVHLLTRGEGDLPRTLLIPVDRLPGTVVEATGYGLRLAERR